jgi:homocysteine S-methyltransferase
MDFESAAQSERIILTEGAVIERIRRESRVRLDPYILHAGFVFDAAAREVLAGIYRDYLDIAASYRLPIIVGTPTWRANPERVASATTLPCDDINRAGVEFLEGIRSEYGNFAKEIYICAMIGPKGNAYDPSDSPSVEEAAESHEAQIQSLADTDADFLLAATLPSAREACGMARIMGAMALTYVLSFVVRPSGRLLDGTPLHEAVSVIDDETSYPPLCYFVNCVHPAVFHQAMESQLKMHPWVAERVWGLQANTSVLPPEALDGCAILQGEDPSTFADLMAALNRDFGTKILGGCCGTGPEHIRHLAALLGPAPLKRAHPD